ncbi:hypothetical protein [Poriferisphaera corsica]|nr:hypothetical protein [Poriferisphaera corsica]
MTNESKTIERNWCDLKPGDVICLGGNWLEVFDAYPTNHDTVTIKVITAYGIQPVEIQSASKSKVTCKIY